MNFKFCYFFTMLRFVQSDILSVGIVNNEFNVFVENLVLKNLNNSSYIGIFHDSKRIREINLLQLLESRYAPVILHDLSTPEVLYNSTDAGIVEQTMPLTDYNIILIEDSKSLHSMLEVVKRIPFFSARTNMLIILTGRVDGTESWIRKIFSELWKIYILNVGLVFHTDRVNVFTYIPWTTPHEIQNLTEQGISANIFYIKLKNLHKYPVKILEPISDVNFITVNRNESTIYLGVDGETMNTILEHHNATKDMIKFKSRYRSPCRFVHYNNTIEGLFGAYERNKSIGLCPYSLRLPQGWKTPSELHVVHNDVDVSFNSRPLRFDMDYRVDTTAVQAQDSYCVIVPANNKRQQVLNLLLPFEVYMWLAIVLNFIVITVIYFGIQTPNGTSKKGFFHTCFMLYSIQMNSFSRSLRKLKDSERVYLLCWVIYSFLISVAYQSVIISFIIVPFYAQSINRLEELKEVDFSIFVQADILADMHNVINKETREILSPKLVLDVWTDERKYDMEKGYLLQESTARYLLQRKDLRDKGGKSLFHLMNECPMPVLTAYQMPRGSPLLEIIDNFTSRKIECGLANIWAAKARHYLNSRIPKRNEHSETHIRLTLAHLNSAFYILSIGQLLAMSVFCFELYWKRITRLIHVTKSSPQNSQ